MIRVLIVDDHPIVREGVSTVLEREPDIEVVGMGGTIDDGSAARGVEPARRRTARSRSCRAPRPARAWRPSSADNPNIIVFTAHDADDDVFRAIRDGARGYLLKGSAAADIVDAIRQVHTGNSYLSPRVAAKLVSDVAHPRARGGLLSPRERGVLRLVAAGLSNRQIAETLSLSERTIKFHVTAILNKLGADNRAQAVALAAERGLLPSR